MTHMTDGERLTIEHGGVYTHGGWSRASGLNEIYAHQLADALTRVHYQIRHVLPDEKTGKWVVVFR